MEADVTRKRFRGLAIAGAAFVGVFTSTWPAFAGCNSGNAGDTNLLTSGACQASASGSFATAAGNLAEAKGNESTALGQAAFARGFRSTAIGVGAGSSGAVDGATTLGAYAGS